MLFKIDARELKESLAVGIYERNICIRSVGTRLRALIEDDYRLSEHTDKFGDEDECNVYKLFETIHEMCKKA